MKILQIIPSVSLVYGGPSRMVLGLSSTLAKLGEDVTILTTNSNGDAGQPPLDVPLRQPIKQDGYEIIYFPCSPFRRYKFSLELLIWLKKQANNYQIAHIHALFSPLSTTAAIISRMCQLPYILRPLGTLDPADLQKKRQLKQIYGNLLEKGNLAAAAGVHFTSEQEAKISYRYGIKTNDIVIPLGVDLPDTLPPTGAARQKLGIAADQPLLLFMSRLDPKKGLDLLIPALEKLLDMGLNFHFVLAGANPQDANYEQQIIDKIKTSRLAKYTTITGFIMGDFKLELLKDADLFVLPSYYENFGIAVAEAMAIGLPVVISDQVHIWPTVIKYQAGWVTSTDINSLTNTLKIGLENPQQRQIKGENARQLVLNEYSWNAIAKDMIEVYQKLGKS
jgi:glycosyltransferase involved in cell wall biosynthesis